MKLKQPVESCLKQGDSLQRRMQCLIDSHIKNQQQGPVPQRSVNNLRNSALALDLTNVASTKFKASALLS